MVGFGFLLRAIFSEDQTSRPDCYTGLPGIPTTSLGRDVFGDPRLQMHGHVARHAHLIVVAKEWPSVGCGLGADAKLLARRLHSHRSSRHLDEMRPAREPHAARFRNPKNGSPPAWTKRRRQCFVRHAGAPTGRCQPVRTSGVFVQNYEFKILVQAALAHSQKDAPARLPIECSNPKLVIN
jgi:hypothetical protein